jgi:hypothetical protein
MKRVPSCVKAALHTSPDKLIIVRDCSSLLNLFDAFEDISQLRSPVGTPAGHQDWHQQPNQ